MDKVLVMTQSGDAHSETINAGIRLAKALNRDVEVVAYTYDNFDGNSQFSPRLTRAAQQRLFEQWQTEMHVWMSLQGFADIPLHVIWSDAANIHACEYAEQHGFSLIIKSAYQGSKLPDSDLDLLRQTKKPLLFLTRHPIQRGSNVLVAVDLGSRNLKKLKLNQMLIEYGLQFSQSLNCQLHLAYVIPIPKVLRDMDVLNTRNLVKDAYKKYMPQLESSGLTVEQVHIIAGTPNLCLYEMACRLKSRYLMVGKKQRKGIIGRMLGNTSESLLTRIRSHVLILPSDGD